MNDVEQKVVIEARRLAGETLNVSRLLPKTKENQDAQDKALLVWRALLKLADWVQEKASGQAA